MYPHDELALRLAALRWQCEIRSAHFVSGLLLRASQCSYRVGPVSGQAPTLGSGATREVGHRSACVLRASRFWGIPPTSLGDVLFVPLGGRLGVYTLLGVRGCSSRSYVLHLSCVSCGRVGFMAQLGSSYHLTSAGPRTSPTLK